jgi:hypothetical protein
MPTEFYVPEEAMGREVIIGGVHDIVLIRVLPPAFTQVTRVAGAKLGVDFH